MKSWNFSCVMMKTFFFRYFNGANIQVAMLVCIVFLIPMLDFGYQPIAYKISFTMLMLISAFLLQVKRKMMLTLIVIALIILEWLATEFSKPFILQLSQTTKGIYFIFIVFSLIRQTAMAARVTERVIADAISGYLLLGMVFSIGTVMIAHQYPGAFSFTLDSNVHYLNTMNDYIYFAFTTFTTTGYGDMLPLHPVAKSFSIFTAASGQLYIATIISLLVGKYASAASRKD